MDAALLYTVSNLMFQGLAAILYTKCVLRIFLGLDVYKNGETSINTGVKTYTKRVTVGFLPGSPSVKKATLYQEASIDKGNYFEEQLVRNTYKFKPKGEFFRLKKILCSVQPVFRINKILSLITF